MLVQLEFSSQGNVSFAHSLISSHCGEWGDRMCVSVCVCVCVLRLAHNVTQGPVLCRVVSCCVVLHLDIIL